MSLDAELRAIYRHARDRDIQELAPHIQACMDRYQINTPLRKAHFLAQIGHESGQLRYREEIASGAAYEGRQDLGNTRPGDGRRFKGRGLIQLTGRANYAAYDQDKALGGMLLREPGFLATNPALCCDVAGWFWDRRALNALADEDALHAITRKINGGLNGLEDRAALLARAKSWLWKYKGQFGQKLADAMGGAPKDAG